MYPALYIHGQHNSGHITGGRDTETDYEDNQFSNGQHGGYTPQQNQQTPVWEEKILGLVVESWPDFRWGF
jgi:hypothetical protein